MADGFNFQEFLGGAGDLVLDYARTRSIDIEQYTDTNNIPDRADIADGRANQVNNDTFGGALTRSAGGVPVWAWGVGLVAAAFAVNLLRR